MKILTLLDGPNLGVLAAIGFIYIILPLVAIILLIWFFVKRNKKKKQQ